MRILLVEDHPTLGQSLKSGLEKSYYAVDLSTNGREAYTLGSTISYDLIVLDVMLPDLDGFQVCQQLRAQNHDVPVLFLTALSQLEDRVKGLNIGGDDYLTKPFAFREFEARVRALLRRQSHIKTSVLRFIDIVMDTTTQRLERGGRVINLPGKEFALLEFLLRHPGEVISRDMLVDHIWNIDANHISNIVDFHICSLRTKLCEQGEADIIQTIRGFGYQLKEL